MKKLIALLAVVVTSALAVGAYAGTTKVVPKDECAKVGKVVSTKRFSSRGAMSARKPLCGNQSYRWYFFESSPPGGTYVGWYGEPCSYAQYGYIAYAWDYQGYRYTIQCRQA